MESFKVPYLAGTLKHQQAGVSGPGQFPCPQCGKTYKYVNNSTFSYFFHNMHDTNWFWRNYVYLIWSKICVPLTQLTENCNMDSVFYPYFYLYAKHVCMHWNNEIIYLAITFNLQIKYDIITYRDTQIFQKSLNHLKILGAMGNVKQVPQILGTSPQNLVTQAIWYPAFEHPCVHSYMIQSHKPPFLPAFTK